jgi:molybdenum cofactor synthesis domain-containing protein
MKAVHLNQAVGMVLGQDLTRVTTESKEVAFKKGHVIRAEDVPYMLNMGKERVYVMKFGPDDVHENEAAQAMAEIVAGSNLALGEPVEGKVNIKSDRFGLLKIDSGLLTKINRMKGVALSTLHNDTIVRQGQLVASAKIIPLILPRVSLGRMKEICTGREAIGVRPFEPRKAGMVVTGNEIYYGRIKDKFEGVIRKKLADFGSTITQIIFMPDDSQKIASAIRELAANNDLVVTTGGMSVDPDDVTPLAVRKSGAKIVVYGTPVMPGAMFLIAYLGSTPILGMPACGMFSKITVLDVVLPKVLLGEKITRQYIASLGHGGLCQTCTDGCRYPNCSFCK